MPSESVFFIDSSVSNFQSLVGELPADAEVFVLNSDSDGLAQMVERLQGRSGIDAIYVISHGNVGAVHVGSIVLDSTNLEAYSEELARLGDTLTETGDILLYGCNVAQGDDGVRFIDSLARLTGADVFASTNATGSSLLGGDWVLERSTDETDTFAVRLLETSALGSLSDILLLVAGKVTTSFGGYGDIARSITLQPDGKILVAGTGNNQFALARYNANGSLDTTFDSDGKVTTSFDYSSSSAYSVVLQSDRKIIVGGTSGIAFGLARYNIDGSLDTSFDLMEDILNLTFLV